MSAAVPRRASRRVGVYVEVSLSEIDSEDLKNELLARGHLDAAGHDELAHIYTLQVCGQRDAANHEALAYVDRLITNRFRSSQAGRTLPAFATTLAGVAALAAALSWLGPTVLDDNHAEHAAAASLEDAQRAEAAALRRDLAAARICREQHGEAGYTWTAAGQLVCVPRRGKPVQFAAGGAQ